ncbi:MULTISPECIES: methyltransferase [unclassified Pseudoalteromonas]|uniref:methyltransferase n=1 Tax=unclassified Pseudoalteromonas TaxID=194690 RepID=UPI0004167073|nr:MULTISPECIES: methyltransferase [unclassified Pseudoalteromonas]MDC9497276.1 methyltransferase [Pseudoalteromonas sp. Angola-20]MDC9517493.1 methyltransferase [Pseudoalteromonas sp. Angola-22]MDC9533787.1 methyltransferase [Pseudoalteromonas sp. Angola-9]TMP81093.1 methyltransferase domain-containing protein [Pseudoalteromonas sp. S983]
MNWIICGMHGAGKTSAAQKFAQSNYNVISVSSVLRNLAADEYNIKDMTPIQLLAFGEKYLAELGEQELANELLKKVSLSMNNVIEGIRPLQTALTLKKALHAKIVFIKSSSQKRYSRIKEREGLTFQEFVFKEENVVEKMSYEIESHADYIIYNEADLDDFYKQIIKIKDEEEKLKNDWKYAAEKRKEQIESGLDITYHKIFLPKWLEIVESSKAKHALEIGAGTGHLTKEISSKVISLDAIEPSLSMFEVASQVLRGSKVNIFNESSFTFKTEFKYDLIYSHMCSHCIKDFSAHVDKVMSFLGTGGDFIFSIPHPCFYHFYKNHFKDDFDYVEKKDKDVDFIISSDPNNVLDKVSFYHRPLEYYINTLADKGLNIAHIMEVTPNNMGIDLYWEFPRYLIIDVKS